MFQIHFFQNGQKKKKIQVIDQKGKEKKKRRKKEKGKDHDSFQGSERYQ